MSTAIPPVQYRISRMYSSLPFQRLKHILMQIVSDAILVGVEECNSTHLSRLYTLNMSNGQKLLLSYAPSLSVRLLRHEAALLNSEALLLHFLASSIREPMVSKTEIENCCQLPTLSKLIPKLLKHSSNNRELNYPYTIFELVAGDPLSSIPTNLQDVESRKVYKQLGSVARELATLTSPTGSFGSVTVLLPDSLVESAVTSETRGWKTWPEAFQSLLEGILRDAEDLSVLLPYEAIRDCYLQSRPYLGLVLTSRLTVLDLAGEKNIMIETDLGTTGPKLSGLRSWSHGIFGDPLISNCFDNPREGFLDGWREGGEDIIEGQEYVHIRILLYKCFRTVIDIVTEHYRPSVNSSERELLARQILTSTLADLEKALMINNETLLMTGRATLDPPGVDEGS